LKKQFEELDSREIPRALEDSEEGRTFLARFREYLDEFGWRSDGIYEIGDATWREDPTIALNTIQGYMRLGEKQNPDLTLERATQRREELTRAAREKLAGDPDKLRRFDDLMEAAKYNTRV